MILDFLRDRRHDKLLKAELEKALEELKQPKKEGSSLEGYFQNMVTYVQDFCRFKMLFLPDFEARHGVIFSDSYRRRYLTKCYDSLAEDLHKICLEFFSLDFVFLAQKTLVQAQRDHGETESSMEAFFRNMEHRCLERLEEKLLQWYYDPLTQCLDKVLRWGSMDVKRQKELREVNRSNYETFLRRGRKEITQFCRPRHRSAALEKFQSICRESRTRFPALLEKLRQQGFDLSREYTTTDGSYESDHD